MRAVDTNVIVRLLIGDDTDQFDRADALFRTHDLFIATSVLLETEWVLRKGYRLAKLAIVKALRDLAGAENVHVQDPLLLHRALDWVERGLDLADALHLAGSTGCSDFVSFDRPLAQRAKALATIQVVEP